MRIRKYRILLLFWYIISIENTVEQKMIFSAGLRYRLVRSIFNYDRVYTKFNQCLPHQIQIKICFNTYALLFVLKRIEFMNRLQNYMNNQKFP